MLNTFNTLKVRFFHRKAAVNNRLTVVFNKLIINFYFVSNLMLPAIIVKKLRLKLLNILKVNIIS